jgi:hypothetical protein
MKNENKRKTGDMKAKKEKGENKQKDRDMKSVNVELSPHGMYTCERVEV